MEHLGENMAERNKRYLPTAEKMALVPSVNIFLLKLISVFAESGRYTSKMLGDLIGSIDVDGES